MPVMANCRLVGVVFAIAVCFCGGSSGTPYYGKLLGKLSELHHGVSGEVYAVDGRTLYIKDFTYDGQGPAAYFYASTYKSADKKGFRLRDENGGGEVIRRYRKEGVTLTLPEGKHLNNIKIFYVWCEEFDVNFGDVKIPKNFDYPRPLKIDALRGVHAVASDNIVIVDAQTLLVPNLSYDGEAPDAKFWVGKGPKPSPQGIRVPDENGKEVPLRRYDRKTVVLTLPGDLTVFDIGHFGIWCEAFAVDFGHIQIPQLPNIPPSLKMLGVSPQKKHHQVDIPKVSQARPRPLVGGHLQPITYRPPTLPASFHNRRNDDSSSNVEILNSLRYVHQPFAAQQQFIQPLHQQQQIQPFGSFGQPSQFQFVTQQPRLLNQNHLLNQQTQLVAQPSIITNQKLQPVNQHLVNQQQPQFLNYQSQFVNQKLQPVHQQPNQLPHYQFQIAGQQSQLVNPQLKQLHSSLTQNPQFIYQQPHQNQQLIGQTQQVFQQQGRPAVGYTPFNFNQRQYQERQVYNHYLQARKLEELNNQLSRQHNRFDLTNNQHVYG